jgi:MFS family permease
MLLASEFREYTQRVGSFSRNARLYLLATTLHGLGGGIWGVIFYLYLNLDEIGFQPNFISNMFTVGAIATGLVALPAGLLCERVGTKRAILISQTANLLSLIQVFALQSSVLLLTSLSAGLISTVGGVAGAPFMMRNSKEQERTYLFSLNWTISTITAVIGNFAGGFMPDIFNSLLALPTGAGVGSAAGYRLTLLISLTLILVGSIPYLLIKEEKPTSKPAISRLLSLKNIQNPFTIVKFMIPVGIIGFGAGFIVPLFSLFFKLRFTATAQQIGAIFALGSVTLAVGTFVAPTVASKMGKVRAVVVCQFLSMPFIMLVTLSPNLTFATVAYLTRGALMNMAGPINTTFQMEMVSEGERATTSGLTTMADSIPRAATASISGALMTGNDFYTPFLFTTITYFCASSLYYVFFRGAEKNKQDQRSSLQSESHA